MAEDSSKHLHARSASEDLLAQTPNQPADSGNGPSINVTDEHEHRPPPVKHLSAPAFQSPARHHKRTPSRTKGVKETLDAKSQYGSGDDNDGASVHRINQYIIKQEIGRGSFGAVHLAQDQFGHEFAVKEFSKSRLRKRAQSNLLRNPNQGRRPGQLAAGLGFNSPMHRISSDKQGSQDANNSLSLIKEEIAIMKKLDHNNLVSLIEVLDDPQEDSLYMVLEMCKKGVAMKVGLDERAHPYDDETCRCWFRDMILGIEYLHAQGIIHRDIKPDNCLITDEDVLKIVDFGVSEMFEKQSEMATAKSAGSPAFMPPELCVAKHGQVSGRAADIWSMGVTLYCLRYGHIPFEKGSMIELYDAIRNDDLPAEEERDSNFDDLIKRILDKDPDKRITMDEIRNHPWVTKDGTDPLLPAEENCADLVEPPTEAEMDNAITGNMAHLMAVMKAVKRFKTSVSEKRGRFMDGILGRDSRLTAPPSSFRSQAKSQDTDDRKPYDKILVTSGIHRDVDVTEDAEVVPPDMEHLEIYQSPIADDESDFERRLGETEAHWKQRLETIRHHPNPEVSGGTPMESPEEVQLPRLQPSRTFPVDGRPKGHAHDPLEDMLFLNIGHDPTLLTTHDDFDVDYPMVSESPPAVEMNIYEQAYQEEMERILARRGREPSIYMTRRVEHRDDIRHLSSIKDAGKYAARQAAARFERVSNRAYAHGRPYMEYGRSYARYAGDKASEGWLSGSQYAAPYVQSGKDWAEPWKQSGKDYVQSGREWVEPWKQSAKSAASSGYEGGRYMASRAHEKISALYNRSGSGGEETAAAPSTGSGSGFSGLVAKMQRKAGGEKSEGEPLSAPANIEKPESTPEPAPSDQKEKEAPPAPTTTTEEIRPSETKKEKSVIGAPIGTSVFKEHI